MPSRSKTSPSKKRAVKAGNGSAPRASAVANILDGYPKPIGAKLHATAPATALNDPTGHGLAAVEPAPLTKVPAGARMHDNEPATAEKLPGAH